jgi:hypothetical protein
MVELTSHLSPYTLGGLILLAFVAVSVATLLVVRRWFPWLMIEEPCENVGTIFGTAIGTTFALVFALVTIAVWQNYDRVANAVGEEASTIHNIYRYLDAYPPDLRNPTQQLMRAYLKRMIDQEWPQLVKGLEDPETHRLITDINARLVAYRPTGPGDMPLHSEMLAQISSYRSLRHGRLQSSKAYVDASMWICLILGSLTLMVFCSIFRSGDRRQMLIMTVTLGCSLGVVFFLLMAYNHPFAGPEAITAAPFQALLDNNW